MSELGGLLDVALELADLAKALSVASWRGQFAVQYKQDGSTLTDADEEIETRWREAIRQRFPHHGVLGEEYGTDAGSSAFTWVLDPIDGTRQFATGLLNYASLISVCRDNEPILGVIDLPIQEARYVALEGQGTRFAGRVVRCSGQHELEKAVVALANPDSFQPSTAPGFDNLRAIAHVRVYDGGSTAYGALARGLIDVCLNADDLDAYDICALCPVVQEAGGLITDWNGNKLGLGSKGGIVASASRALHARVLDGLLDVKSGLPTLTI